MKRIAFGPMSVYFKLREKQKQQLRAPNQKKIPNRCFMNILKMELMNLLGKELGRFYCIVVDIAP